MKLTKIVVHILRTKSCIRYLRNAHSECHHSKYLRITIDWFDRILSKLSGLLNNQCEKTLQSLLHMVLPGVS